MSWMIVALVYAMAGALWAWFSVRMQLHLYDDTGPWQLALLAAFNFVAWPATMLAAALTCPLAREDDKRRMPRYIKQ